MRLTLFIHYNTHGDEQPAVRYDGQSITMAHRGNGLHEVTLDIEAAEVCYAFEIVAHGTVVRHEWGDQHCLTLPIGIEQMHVVDAWREKPQCVAYTTSLFTESACAHPTETRPYIAKGDCYFEVEAPAVRHTERVAIIGASEALGAWQQPRQMRHIGKGVWAISLHIAERTDYKFVVTDGTTGHILQWEQGENRVAEATDTTRCMLGARLREAEPWRGAGVAVPVFSLRSEHSCGVGEFADLRMMVDWCAACGQSVIQILPVNDTTMDMTWRDSYPYNAISIYALHPLYIRLSEVGQLRNKRQQSRFEREAQRLNALPALDYEAVIRLKMEHLRLLYEEQCTELLQSEEYASFCRRNDYWLDDYALFSALRDKFRTADFKMWGEWAAYNRQRAADYTAEHQHEVGFYRFAQYHLDRQLTAVRDYARAHGIVLKGDIPIGISRTSVEAWVSPELFVMESSAGAPPDDFSATGQNWGFPIYNWERMSKDGYAWWRARFAKMSEYFDAYRIDHILGFFRIWEVPLDAVNALLGEFNPSLPYTAEEIAAAGLDFEASRDVAHNYTSEDVLWLEYRHGGGFYPRISSFDTDSFKALDEASQCAFARLHDDFYYRRHNAFWHEVATSRLGSIIGATRMLACGEDLGMIPQCVPDVMAEQQILSLEIERMPKQYGATIAEVECYPYLSVCTTSTHDMSPLRLWWSESREQAEYYYRHILHLAGEVPQQADSELCRAIVQRNLDAPSMLAILPLQDWLSASDELRAEDTTSERINIPANPRHYWRYRMHLTLESLIEAESFCRMIREMVERSGR